MAHKNAANAGETLVEVMASIFIFLIMVGILQLAVSYSGAALQKNKEIRADNAAILQSLAGAEVTSNGTDQNVTFKAANSDLTQFGKEVFTVSTKLLKKEVTYTDTDGQQQSVTFCLYGTDTKPASDTDTGSGSGADEGEETADDVGGGGS